jgi:hypothetical protein
MAERDPAELLRSLEDSNRLENAVEKIASACLGHDFGRFGRRPFRQAVNCPATGFFDFVRSSLRSK